MDVNPQTLFLEVSPLPESGLYTVTSRTRQPPKDDGVIVKEEGDENNEALLDQIIGNLEDEPANASASEKINCAECHYTTNSADRLLRHVRKVHRGLNPFQCYMCDYSTYNKVLFEDHVRIHRGIKPFKCSYCDYCSASKKNTKKHELIHRPDNPLRCAFCGFIARHHRALECHRKTHGIGNGDEESKKDEEPSKIYKCDSCNTILKDYKVYSYHRRKRRKCPECSLILCTKGTYQDHMADVHNNYQPKPRVFQCQVCDYSVNSKARMLLHLIHHPNQTVDENVLDISILRKYGIMV